jgi:biotin carboxylase
MFELQKIIPFVPYLRMPSESSIQWTTEKKYMRELIGAFNSNLVPKYYEVHKFEVSIIDKICEKLQFPVIVKPSGLEGSLLVAKASDKAELENIIKKSFDKIQFAYDTWIKRQKPFLLVEEFMEGKMYSIDSYVSYNGKCTHLPPVKVITGHEKGLHDFFGYERLTPSDLNDSEIIDANKAVEDTVKALGVKSITVHVELMYTNNGWKIIELGPRIGGYRHDMYQRAFGINHIMNDILNRMGREPIINTEPLGQCAVFNIYSSSEGQIKDCGNIEAIKKLNSFVSCKQNLYIGDNATFARHNGDPIFEIELFNKDRFQLQEDIEFMESNLRVVVN